jgi:hypothetical protein
MQQRLSIRPGTRASATTAMIIRCFAIVIAVMLTLGLFLRL